MQEVAKGMTMTVLRRADGAPGPSVVTVVGVLVSHDQDVVHDLPTDLRISPHNLTRPAVALEARALHQTTEHRLVVAVPVSLRPDGRWERGDLTFMAGGSHLAPDDSRMSAFLRDLSGYAYDPAVPLHDRTED